MNARHAYRIANEYSQRYIDSLGPSDLIRLARALRNRAALAAAYVVAKAQGQPEVECVYRSVFFAALNRAA